MGTVAHVASVGDGRGRRSSGDAHLSCGGGTATAGVGASQNADAQPRLASALRETGKEGRLRTDFDRDRHFLPATQQLVELYARLGHQVETAL
jgi:hypothetical protein